MVQRETNFELLRIVAMFFIVLGHCILHGMRHITSSVIPDLGFCTSSPVDMLNFGTSQFLTYMAICGVNLFVLITGYFISKPVGMHKIMRKFFRLWRMMVIYGVIVLIFAYLYCGESLTAKSIVTVFTPIYHNSYWFMTQYLALYLLSPFIARLLGGLDKAEFELLLGILFLLTFQLGSIGYGDLFLSGASLLFFVFLFSLGSYIRRFNPFEKYQRYGLVAFCISCLVLALLSVFAQIAHLGMKGHDFLYIKSFANNSLTLFNSLALFMYFKTVHINRHWLNTAILACSPYVLGVYLIHDNPVMRKVLWGDIGNYVHEGWFIPGMLLYVLLVFAFCLVLSRCVSFVTQKIR